MVWACTGALATWLAAAGAAGWLEVAGRWQRVYATGQQRGAHGKTMMGRGGRGALFAARLSFVPLLVALSFSLSSPLLFLLLTGNDTRTVPRHRAASDSSHHHRAPCLLRSCPEQATRVYSSLAVGGWVRCDFGEWRAAGRLGRPWRVS